MENEKSIYGEYETVVGLEVHAQLLTETKLFCGDGAGYGAPPNSHTSPITLAHPGTLPVLNKKAVELAVRMGLACHSKIAPSSFFARKNYFYPDLPKGYQVSQHSDPVCVGGHVTIRTPEGEKKIRLHHIHLEEDAGKSIHDADPDFTCVDYNRAGVPLIEIVSEPDIRSGADAALYLAELRKTLRYLDVCDGNMEEGSMRCDANISVRKKGDTRLGTRVEVKNLNSIRNVKRAIEWEAARLVDILEAGGTIAQQTRSFDANTGTSFALRSKEEADDYRYFPDPDLPPFRISETMIADIQSRLPALPEARKQRYMQEWRLSEYDAQVITEDRDTALYFENLVAAGQAPKAAANWMNGPVKSWLNDKQAEIAGFPLPAAKLALLIGLVEEGRVSFSAASSRIFPMLIANPERQPLELAGEMNLMQESDSGAVAGWVDEVLARMPDKVKEFKKGKKGLTALFVGEVMRLSKGKADPKLVNQLLAEKLKAL